MAEVPQWRLAGDWFDVCSCNIACPCEFAQAPTNDACTGVLAYHIREGRYGDVSLDGLNVLGVVGFEGNVWAGSKVAIGMFVDDRADEAQLGAIQMIFGGQAGGWPGAFASLIGDLRGVEVAPVTIEVDKDLGGWRCEVPGKVAAEAVALTGPTSGGGLVQMTNPPGSEVGPLPAGAVVTWGKGVSYSADTFGFKNEFEGTSSKHIPFEWSGPDE